MRWPHLISVASTLLMLQAGATLGARAQEQTPAPPAPAAPPPPPAPAAAPPQALPPPSPSAQHPGVFTHDELVNILQSIALYPDELLAQMLPAAAYPLEIVQAARWIERNRDAVSRNDFSGADAQNWDPSVKAMVRLPGLVTKMNEQLTWTSDLGDAFVNQPQDVANVIQELRLKAADKGTLTSTPEQVVTRRVESGRDVVYIQPANPEVIYVPTYDPAVVYGPGPLLTTALVFGAAAAIGSIWYDNYWWNWGSGRVYPPVWPGYPGWRPPPPRPPGGWRPPPPPPPPGGFLPGNPGAAGPRPTPLPAGGVRPG
ncbi:DUF3300 domain-containing protein, partial [Alsobacter sp. SYSU M60028]